jgi:hypothetical protein
MRDGVAYFFKIFHGKNFYIKIHPTLFQNPLNRFFYIEIENSNVFKVILEPQKVQKKSFFKFIKKGFFEKNFKNFLYQNIGLFNIYKMICFIPKSVKYKKNYAGRKKLVFTLGWHSKKLL